MRPAFVSLSLENSHILKVFSSENSISSVSSLANSSFPIPFLDRWSLPAPESAPTLCRFPPSFSSFFLYPRAFSLSYGTQAGRRCDVGIVRYTNSSLSLSVFPFILLSVPSTYLRLNGLIPSLRHPQALFFLLTPKFFFLLFEIFLFCGPPCSPPPWLMVNSPANHHTRTLPSPPEWSILQEFPWIAPSIETAPHLAFFPLCWIS